MTQDPGRPRDPDIDQRIVDTARALLDREGAAALSVARVALEAGVGRPTVYRRYRHADDLLRAILFDELGRISTAQRNRPAPDGNVTEGLVALARASIDYYAHNPERGRALLQVSMLADPTWQARWTALNTEVAEHAFAVVERAIQAGELPRDTDRPLLLQSYLFLLLATLVSGLAGAFGPNAADWGTALQRMLDQHVDGLRLRARQAGPPA
jgi:AcrR family transcriptional regulator